MRSLLVLFAALANPALAQDMKLVAPVYSQIVVSAIPAGFVRSFEHAESGYYTHEATLAGQTADDWTQMVTLTGAQDKVAKDRSLGLLNAAQGFAANYAANCPASFSLHQFPTANVPGAQGTLAVLFGCGTLDVAQQSPGGPGAEAAVVVFAAGAREIYTFQWAEHFAPEAGPQTFLPQDWLPRLTKLLAVARVCDPVPGEEPPYPSCSQ